MCDPYMTKRTRENALSPKCIESQMRRVTNGRPRAITATFSVRSTAHRADEAVLSTESNVIHQWQASSVHSGPFVSGLLHTALVKQCVRCTGVAATYD